MTTRVLQRLTSVGTRVTLAAYVPARTVRWENASRLFILGDGVGWSIDDDRARLSAVARRLGYAVAPSAWARYARRQSVFHPDHFGALRPGWLESSHRLGLSYFHGRPGTVGYPEFDRAYEALRQYAARVDRVQVTHAEMHEIVLAAGVEANKVFRIPIGVDLSRFPLGGSVARASARTALGLPQSAFVLGSFQKDGVGLGEGIEPKWIKGPDVLVAALQRLRRSTPNLVVLLTGLARGYVRTELGRLRIPYRHLLLRSRDDLAQAYHALDAYLVTSRQEGGPKAVLESMATGVPLVSTRVGQATELVVDHHNGLLVDVDDVGGLAAAVERVHDDSGLRRRLCATGRATAEAYAEGQLDARWGELLRDFVGEAQIS